MNLFHCIPRGQCQNLRQLSWSEIGEDFTRYKKFNNWMAIPFNGPPNSKVLFVKFPKKINFDLVTFNVWNGELRQTFCDKGLSVLEIEMSEPNVLLEFSYDREKYKAKDFSDRESLRMLVNISVMREKWSNGYRVLAVNFSRSAPEKKHLR